MVLCTVSPKSLSGKAFTEKDIKRRIITRFCDRVYQNITYKIEPIDVSRLYEFAFTMHRAVVTGIVAALMIVSTILVICSIEKKTLSGPRNDADIRFEKYKSYCVVPYVVRGQIHSDLSSLQRITLAIHLSENYLDERILDQVDSWDGTVSVALFISSYDILGKIERLKRKFSTMPSNILEKLSVHVVFYSNETCRLQSVAYLNDTTDRLYPANVVRNIARMYVHSKYILPTDYEFVFSKDFEGKMRALADRELTRNPKMVLVSRTFEVSDTVKRLPRVKDPLYSLYRAGQAVEFHARYYPGAHKISGIDGWFAHKESEKASINSVLKLQKASWEPQFVSFSTIPLHDENFPYSIRDNSVLRWEMCRQNYTFAIVNDVFMVHRGIKLPRDIANTSAAQKKLKPQFKQALELFTQRMKETYPETAASCPKFTA